MTYQQWIRDHRIAGRLGIVLAAGIAAVLFFCLGLLFRILIGPVSLGPLNPQLRQALRDQLPGLQLRFDEAALAWSRDEGRVNLVIFGTRVFDQYDRIIAQAPEAEIGLAAGPFLSGRIVVQRITLVGVQLTLVHTRSGALRLGVERDRAQSDILKQIQDAITKSASGGPSSLRSFSVHRARLAFFDEETGAFVVAPEAELQLGSSKQSGHPGSLIAAIDAQLEVSGRASHLLATINLPRNDKPVTADFSLTGISIAALASNAKTFAFLKPFALTGDVSGSFTLEHGTVLRDVDLGIAATGSIEGFGKPLKLKSIRFVGRYDGRTGRVLIDDANLLGNELEVHLSGTSDLTMDAGGELSSSTFSLDIDRFVANMPAVMPQGIGTTRALVRGVYSEKTRQIKIDQLAIVGGPLSASFAGSLSLADDKSPAIAIDGKVNALGVHDLLRYWPSGVGTGARDWISRNISAARVGPILVHTAIGEGVLDQSSLPENAVTVSFPVSAATVGYIRGLTPVTGVTGTALLTGDTFKADVVAGRIGPLSISNAKVVIPNLHKHGMVGDIRTHVFGSLQDVLKLVDMKPLGYATRFHVNPATTEGVADLDLAVQVPMVRDLKVDNVAISIRSSVTNLALSLGPRTRIVNAKATFDIDNHALRASGTVPFGAAALNVDWNETFSTAPVTTHVVARGRVDSTALGTLGLRVGDIISGPIDVVASLEGHRGAIGRATIAADLTSATVGVDFVNLKKPAGIPARADINAHFDSAANLRQADIVLGGTTLSARGTAAFDTTGALERLELTSVKDGGFNDFSVSMSDAPSAGLTLSITGRSADGTALGRKRAQSAGTVREKSPESSEMFHVSAKLDRLLLREGINLAPFALDVTGTGARPRTLSLSAMVSKSAQVAASITTSESGRKLALSTGDAGSLLRGLFGFTSIRGGQLAVNAVLPPIAATGRKDGTDISGQVLIRDCTLVNQAFLTRLFSSGSLEGFVDLMRGQGIALDALQIPFRINGDVVEIHDARATGPSIGVTTDGYVDRANDQLALQGAIAPLYGINGVLGSIPVLGNVFVGKQGEGIFGVTYRATGNADEPQVTVNPLAMLAPGIFRRIFEGSAPSAPPEQASSDAPKKP